MRSERLVRLNSEFKGALYPITNSANEFRKPDREIVPGLLLDYPLAMRLLVRPGQFLPNLDLSQ